MRFNFKLEDIKYIKILYKDKDNVSFNSRAAIKRINEREILACAKFEDGLNIDTPQEVTLSIVCNDGLYKTKTKLKDVDNDMPYTFFVLETPQGIEYEQNREYFRVAVKYECVYKIIENDSVKEFTAKTADISANGISLILPVHAISETSSGISVSINGRVVQAKVRFVRSEKVEEGYKISFAYTKISESDRDFISQVCLQRQLEERRNNLR